MKNQNEWLNEEPKSKVIRRNNICDLHSVACMKLTFMQFHLCVIKQEEEVNNNIEERLQTLLKRELRRLEANKKLK